MATKKTEEVQEVEVEATYTNTVEIEEGLELEVTLKPTDMRYVLTLEEFEKYNRKIERNKLTDSDSLKMIGVISKLLKLLLGEDGFEEAIEFYVDKHNEFSVDDMTSVIEKAFGAVEKK